MRGGSLRQRRALLLERRGVGSQPVVIANKTVSRARILTKTKRSEMMSRIHSTGNKDTEPQLNNGFSVGEPAARSYSTARECYLSSGC